VIESSLAFAICAFASVDPAGPAAAQAGGSSDGGNGRSSRTSLTISAMLMGRWSRRAQGPPSGETPAGARSTAGA
jgi:hypothetical protein